MSELPAPFPCWPCVRRTIQDARCLIRGGRGKDLDNLLIVNCHWQGPDDRDGKCTPCCRVGGNCGSAPTFLQENVKEFIDTMAYIAMVIKLDSPPKRQERILKEWLRTGGQATEDFQPEDRVLPEVTWKDLVAATITLGTRLNGIIERYTEKENERKEVVGTLLSRCKYLFFSPNEIYKLEPRMVIRLAPRRLNGSDEEYLPWNAAAREFHADVLGALRRVLLNDHLARTIMENIPVKWTPATDEEALEAAKMAILEADPTLRF